MVDNRNYIIDRLKSKVVSIDEFNFDRLQAPPISAMFTPYDISRLNQIARSIRYSGNPELKFKEIDKIMRPRGFVKFISGTNRVIYRAIEDSTFVVKVAIDAVGLGDNPREFKNQFIFKPFVTKVFEVTPCGTLGVFERVIPITSREEFLSVADNIYELINKWFIGEYVLEDIGTNYFLNWGIRKGVGVVLLDFPYVYKLDGNKLYCNAPSNNTQSGYCEGVIDYDPGFNHLYCTKCGVRYKARELEKAIENDEIIVKSEGDYKMKVLVKGGTKNVSKTVVTGEYADLAKKVPSKPMLKVDDKKDTENHLSKAKEEVITNPSNSSNNETVTIKNDHTKTLTIRDGRGEVVPAVEFDNNFKSLEDRFVDIVKEIEKVSPSEKFKSDLISFASSIIEKYDTKDEEEKTAEDENNTNSEVNIKDEIFRILDSELEFKVDFNDICYNKDDNMIICKIEIGFYDESTIVWSQEIDLKYDPIGLLDPMYEAGYKIKSGDLHEMEFVSEEDFYFEDDRFLKTVKDGSFVYFASDIINVKDIDGDLPSNKVISIRNNDGELLTVDGQILAINTIDNRSVQNVSIVSKSWLDSTMKELEELKSTDNTEDDIVADVEIMEDNTTNTLPTGMVPPKSKTVSEEVPEKYINGVK